MRGRLPRPVVRRDDAAPGILLAGFLVAWALLAHPTAPGVGHVVVLAATALVAWALGVLLARVHPALPGATVGVAVGCLFLVNYRGVMDGSGAAPLGYENANAALVAAAVAGLLCAGLHSPSPLRWPCYAVAGLATALSVALVGSRAGAVCCLLLIALWPFVRRGTRTAWQIASACTIAAGVLAVLLLGAFYAPLKSSPLVNSTLSEVRIRLWADALELARSSPVTGVGPGNFARLSPTARGDSDLVWAHSAPMQVLAELGLVGLAALLLLLAFLVWHLGRGAAVLAVLALQPMIDYVLDSPLVVAVFALVLGGLSRSSMLNGAEPPHD